MYTKRPTPYLFKNDPRTSSYISESPAGWSSFYTSEANFSSILMAVKGVVWQTVCSLKRERIKTEKLNNGIWYSMPIFRIKLFFSRKIDVNIHETENDKQNIYIYTYTTLINIQYYALIM